ncbi:MAG TPA: histidine phosphatase family protein [Candidatus Saccharibacteria bacterium]|nr:histidine phosphatase family protein [Candidatus Saccharibacteria bacterium]HRQ07276.1 histidine phosphatase family protein [Candidatus Saccharibacteria bacterium]
MDLYLVRHGETQENTDGIVQGWMDTKLNANGKVQALAAAESFNKPIDAIFSSDLQRSTHTANAFRKKYPDIPYFEDARLRERNFGDAQGTQSNKHGWEVFWASKDSVSIPNAETLNDFTARVNEFIESLKNLQYKKILIVTHGGTINRVHDIINKNHEFHAYGNASITHMRITI